MDLPENSWVYILANRIQQKLEPYQSISIIPPCWAPGLKIAPNENKLCRLLIQFHSKSRPSAGQRGQTPYSLTQEGLEASPVSGPIATGIALAPLRLHLSKTAMGQVQDTEGPSTTSPAPLKGVAGRACSWTHTLYSSIKSKGKMKGPHLTKQHSVPLPYHLPMTLRGSSIKALSQGLLKGSLTGSPTIASQSAVLHPKSSPVTHPDRCH